MKQDIDTDARQLKEFNLLSMKDTNYLQKHDYFGFTCISVQAYT